MNAPALRPVPKSRPMGYPVPVIPLHIYQTWHTKTQLLPYMAQSIQDIRDAGPEFEHHLLDDADGRAFLQQEMSDFPGLLEAYDALIPGAYKADLWRYCILYKRGGIYLDVKFRPCPGFRFIEWVDNEYFVMDREDLVGRPALYNAFMVAMPGNPCIKACIEKAVDNVRRRSYERCKLDITGPTMMAQCFPHHLYRALDYLRFEGNENDNYCIVTGEGRKLLEFYREYREEQRSSAKTGYYHHLWTQRQVYRPLTSLSS